MLIDKDIYNTRWLISSSGNPAIEIQTAGMNALKDALGPIGTVRFIQMYNPGYGDYTKEHQEEPDIDPDEAITRIREFKARKQVSL
ncbi:MAG: hypothetical protein LUF30_05550 [Lachnospiraceae bacterium]|nr:hypothetical protein [Lachnospiraceae bacterium]